MPYHDFVYNPKSFSEVDNIFPELPANSNTDTSKYALTHIEFAEKIKEFAGEGDIIEFGVCTGGTIIPIGKANPDRKVFGFDHFKGLEQSSQPTPGYSGWIEGAFRVGDPNYSWAPKSVEDVINKCSESPNIKIFVEDIHDMVEKEPSEYGIGKIGAVHIDLDIYEPTVSAFKFIDKCEWDELYFRFDDWHGHEPDYDHHERKAFREWLDANQYRYEIYEDGLTGGCKVWKN